MPRLSGGFVISNDFGTDNIKVPVAGKMALLL